MNWRTLVGSGLLATALCGTLAAQENKPMLPKTSQLIRDGKPVRIVMYGDSITEVGRSPHWYGGAKSAEKQWGSQLRGMLAKTWPRVDFQIVSFGVGGHNSYEGLGRLDWLAPLKPDLVILAFGTIDCEYHELQPAETQTALTTLAQWIRELYGADVVVAGTGGDNPLVPHFRHIAETVAAARQAAETNGVPFVDLRAAVLTATDNGKRWEKFFNAREDCHPNDRGHELWAETIGAVLTRYWRPAGAK